MIDHRLLDQPGRIPSLALRSLINQKECLPFGILLREKYFSAKQPLL